MKRAVKKTIKILVVLVIVGGLGFGGYKIYESTQAQAQSTESEYTTASVIMGSLEKSVAGTGSLSISETVNITLDFPVTIDSVSVRAGEQVSAGDLLFNINSEALEATISDYKTQIDEIDASIKSVARAHSDTQNLTFDVSGRVKALYGEVGDKTLNIMEEYGALALVSLDGKMKVTFASNDRDLALGDSVTVVDGKTKYTGTVYSFEDNLYTVTFSDATTLQGTMIEIQSDNIIIGKGEAIINMPFYYTTSTEGLITKVNVSVNSKLSRGTTLFGLSNVPIDSEYDSLMAQRDEILNIIELCKEALATGTIASPIDGIINTVSSASSEAMPAGSNLASLYVGESKQMIVSIDELDIINVQVGQNVSIAMDAVTDKTYSATVSYISQIGSSSSGVTNYSVTLDVEGDEQLKMGMNGTATIKIQELNDVLLVPISALNSSRNGQYVWVQSDTIQEGSTDPGIRTTVTTGLSNDNYAQVLSGLELGDTVMITRSAASESNMMQFGMGNFDMSGIDMSNFTMPEGGAMPSMGGGEMPQRQNGGGMGGFGQ